MPLERGQNLVGILVQTMTPIGHFETNWPLVGTSCWVQHRKYISVRGTKQICSTTLFQAKYIMLVSGPMEASTIWVEGNTWKAVPIVKKGLTCLLLSQNIGWADAHPAHPFPLALAYCDRRALHKPISLFSSLILLLLHYWKKAKGQRLESVGVSDCRCCMPLPLPHPTLW